MNSYGPQVNPPPNNYSKKYSLRRRYQNTLQQERSRRDESIHEEGSREQTGWWAGHLQGLNCMESAHNILDFNQLPTLNHKNHTKTLSTTPSFENPFTQPPPQRTADKKSLAASRQDLNPSNAKTQKTSVSHKASYHSSQLPGERIQTENNSQPLSTTQFQGLDSASQAQRRGKFSLKDRQRFNGQTKSQLLICLKYSDLKHPINDKQISSSLLPHNYPLPEYGLAKYLCNTVKTQSGGCSCQPKCHWMDRWLASTSPQDHPREIKMTNSEWEGTLRQIQKDLPRTQPESLTFQKGEHLGWVREVLMNYARTDSEVGYVQGMNFIAAALVFHSRSSEEALQVMQGLMQKCGFRRLLLKDLALSHLLSKRCLYEIKRLAFDLYSHLLREEVQIQIFITSWYFSLLGSFVPLSSMHLIIDKFLRNQFTGLNEIIITLLIYLKDTLLALHDHNLMLAFSGQQMTLAASRVDWEQLVARSDHLQLQPLSL